MSWPWLVLLVLAAALVVAVERPRLEGRFGSAARRDRNRARRRRKTQLRVVTPDEESEEFIRSVQRDLDALPTYEERNRKT